MEKQNITLSIRKDLLKRVKVLAAEQETSVSALMEQLLQDQLANYVRYDQVRQRQHRKLAKGFDLGTKGFSSWSREDLHER